MAEVKIIGKELNGLGLTVKQLIDENIKHPETWKSIEKIEGSLVLREIDADVSVTIFFDKGEISIQNDSITKPSTYLEANFETLAEISSGQLGPIRALMTRKIKAGGNLLKLLRMSKALISLEET